MWLAPDDVATRLGPDYGERLLELLGDGPSEVEALVNKHGLDCEFVRNGTLHCAIGRSGLAKIEERCAQWSARGAPVKLLGREETARRIGVDIYAGSLLDLRAGTIQPLAYARGLARAALAAGAVVHTRSPVRSAERAGKVWRLKTDGGSVAADWVVVATDAYAEGAPWPQGKREQIRVPYFNFATRPLSAELSGLDPAGPRGLLGHADDHELVPLRSGRTASLRQHRRAAPRRSRGPPRLGEARAQEDVSADRRGRIRGAMVWNDGHDRETRCRASIASLRTS